MADNFSSSATAGLIDLNNDGTKDNVYWLTGNSGILVYDVSEGNSLLADTLTMKDNIFSEYFELDINNDGQINNQDLVTVVLSIINNSQTENSSDLNFDSSVDIFDLLFLSDYLLGL